MRLEHVEGHAGGTIINDTWNHDLDGLSTALDALEPAGRPTRAVIYPSSPQPEDAAQVQRLQAIGRDLDRWISVGPGRQGASPG